MAKDLLWLCLFALQVISTGSIKRHGAYVTQQQRDRQVLYCGKCRKHEDPEGDDDDLYDYIYVQKGSLIKPGKTSISRPADSYNSCPKTEFYDDRRLCELINDIQKKTRTPTETKDIQKRTTVTTTSTPKETKGTLTTGGLTTGESKTSRQDEPGDNDDDRNNKAKDKTADANKNDKAGAVSVGVAVALSIIFFLLGLLIMWLIMKFCTKVVLQDIRRKITRQEHKTNLGLQNITNENIVNTSTIERDVTNQTPGESRPDSFHRTSYECLRPENRTSNVYNALDPEYQTHEQPKATAQYPAGEYFVLEKEDHDVVDDRTDTTPIDKNITPTHTSADYFVLEKENTDASYTQIKETETDTSIGATQTAHDYFVLEKESSVRSPKKYENGRDKNKTLDKAGPDYFILEKESVDDKQDIITAK